MLFHTWTFGLFFAIVCPVYLLLRRKRAGMWWLLASSYFFYGWWNPLYLILILYSTALDYFAVLAMARGGRKKLWLAASIINNLLLLGFFKYGGFVAENLAALLHAAGVSASIPPPDVLLPVGISFYTFQSMSYTIDFYRGRVEKEPDFVRFAVFVSLFPQLVAGPIERAASLLPQLAKPLEIGWRNAADGLSLFTIGLFKKIALADCMALYADKVYAAPESFGAPALAMATFAFGWQIYFDFSGYTDMARGVARMMGFDLTLNFNRPYLADSLGDFWRRWHISLSTWFRDYVYIPLGGNRRGVGRMYLNMFFTMVISGLWHGAAWNFVIWGALHALGRVLTRPFEGESCCSRRFPRPVKQALVFLFVTFTWIFFRARGVSQAFAIVRGLFGPWNIDPEFPAAMLFWCLAVWAFQYAMETRFRRFFELAPVRAIVMALMIIYMAVFTGAGEAPFIYFQF